MIIVVDPLRAPRINNRRTPDATPTIIGTIIKTPVEVTVKALGGTVMVLVVMEEARVETEEGMADTAEAQAATEVLKILLLLGDSLILTIPREETTLHHLLPLDPMTPMEETTLLIPLLPQAIITS